jgi:uncharacterized protein (TIGR02452 family)
MYIMQHVVNHIRMFVEECNPMIEAVRARYGVINSKQIHNVTDDAQLAHDYSKYMFDDIEDIKPKEDDNYETFLTKLLKKEIYLIQGFGASTVPVEYKSNEYYLSFVSTILTTWNKVFKDMMIGFSSDNVIQGILDYVDRILKTDPEHIADVLRQFVILYAELATPKISTDIQAINLHFKERINWGKKISYYDDDNSKKENVESHMKSLFEDLKVAQIITSDEDKQYVINTKINRIVDLKNKEGLQDSEMDKLKRSIKPIPYIFPARQDNEFIELIKAYQKYICDCVKSYCKEIKYELPKTEKYSIDRIKQIIINTNIPNIPNKKLPKIFVRNMDVIDLVNVLYFLSRIYEPRDEYRNVFVLNLANNYYPGGGWEKGDSAQEEAIFRRTNSCMVLLKSHYPIDSEKTHTSEGSGQVLYSPEITIISDKMNHFEKIDSFNKQNKFSMVSSAAFRFDNQRDFTQIEHEITKKRIESVFKVAIDKKHKILILGAYGCGAFNNDPNIIYEIFYDNIKKYGGYFEEIYFAILVLKAGGKDAKNYNIFKKMEKETFDTENSQHYSMSPNKFKEKLDKKSP